MFEKLTFACVLFITVALSFFTRGSAVEENPSKALAISVSGYAVAIEDAGSTLLFRESGASAPVRRCSFAQPLAARSIEPGDAITLIGAPDATDEENLTNCSVK